MRRQFVGIINSELAKIGYRLVGTDYFEQRIVYSLAPATEVHDQLPEDIAANTIPIYFGDTAQWRYPCLELISDGWNDWFTYQTKFTLMFHRTQADGLRIGSLKLMKRGENTTKNVLPNEFLTLTEDWCSIGMASSYYQTIKNVLGSHYQSVLYAHRDTQEIPYM